MLQINGVLIVCVKNVINAKLGDDSCHLRGGNMMEFKVGDLAVYPGHGVGRIIDIKRQEIQGASTEFYSIETLENQMKLMVPKITAIKKGLRPVISKDEAVKVISMLKDPDTSDVKVDNQTWNRRHRDYMEKIKTGSVFEIAEVLRELIILKVGKELSFGERKMFDTARALLIKELSLATNSDEPSIEQEVEEIFVANGMESQLFK